MSFILDALKKSEIERQRQSVPGLIDTAPAPRRARFPVWAIALTALLAVNLAVLFVVLARGGLAGLAGHATQAARTAPAASAPGSAPLPGAAAQTQTAAPAVAPATTAQSASTSPAAAAAPTTAPAAAGSNPPDHHFSPMDPAAPVYAPEIPADSVPESAATSGVAAQPGRTSPPASTAGGGQRDPLLTSADDKSDQEVLPTISELDLTGANALPDLHLDVHVYATKPAERFVYINMRKYREGATLAEGPVLERIRRDGVVLDFRGLRFVLPRQ